MCNATSNEPLARATRNKWYLYHSADASRYGSDGFVRAVIEVVQDEVVQGDGGLKHTPRRAFLSAVEMRDTNADQWDKLDETLEAMSDDEFQTLIDREIAIPIFS